MTKPINLNRVRKQRARAEKRADADANSVRFGRSKAERSRDADELDRAARRLDEHKREE